MRKFRIAIAAAAVVALTATAALAAVTFDPATGEGFVGKGDVQEAFGWNNKAVNDNASGVSFTYEEAGEYTVVCSGHSNANQNPNTFKNRSISIEADVTYEARNNKQGQLTGFTLKTLGEETSDGQGCPSAWPIELSRTPNEDSDTVAGLYAHFGGASVLLWEFAVDEDDE